MAGEDYDLARMQAASINNIVAAITCFWTITRPECGASGVAWDRGTQRERTVLVLGRRKEVKNKNKK